MDNELFLEELNYLRRRVLFLEKFCKKYSNIANKKALEISQKELLEKELIYQERFKDIELFYTKTNKEWLELIRSLLNKDNKSYIVTSCYSKKEDLTFILIVANNINLNKINKDMLINSCNYLNLYRNGRILIYDKIKGKINKNNYLQEEKTLYRIFGMPLEVEKQLVYLSFEKDNVRKRIIN